MTDPQALAQGATARPWTVGERTDYLPRFVGQHGPFPIICPPMGAPIACLDERPGVTLERNAADAALIVYAVNHIEQAEAERDEALALLNALVGDGVKKAPATKTILAARAFLRRHDAQPGEQP